jgi:hypothetical protein
MQLLGFMKHILTRLFAAADAADDIGLTAIANELDDMATSIIDETKLSPAAKLSEIPDWEVNGGYNNIMALLKTATTEEVDYWRNWYSNARQDVEALASKYNEPFELVAAVVAVLSPGNNWKSNLNAANNILLEVHGGDAREVGSEPKSRKKSDTSDIYRQFLEEEAPTTFKYRNIPAYPTNAEKARNILVTGNVADYLTGPKVTIFYDSLVHPKHARDHMVLDGHAINIWRGVKVPLKGLRSPSDAERAAMIADYKRAAADSGLSVQEVQAITWFLWKSAEA